MIDLNSVDNKTVLLISAAIIALVAWFFKWLIQRQMNAQFDRLNKMNMEGLKEREFDQYIALRGQQVTNDCLHELIYATLNGTHNGSLEKANKELDEYRAMVDKNVAEKAARCNIKISNTK